MAGRSTNTRYSKSSRGGTRTWEKPSSRSPFQNVPPQTCVCVSARKRKCYCFFSLSLSLPLSSSFSPFPFISESRTRRRRGGEKGAKQQQGGGRKNKKGNGEEGKRGGGKWWKRKPQTFFLLLVPSAPFCLHPNVRPISIPPPTPFSRGGRARKVEQASRHRWKKKKKRGGSF